MQLSLKFDYKKNSGLFGKTNRYSAEIGKTVVEGDNKNDLIEKSQKLINIMTENQSPIIYSWKGYSLVCSRFYESYEYTIIRPNDSGMKTSCTLTDEPSLRSEMEHFLTIILDETQTKDYPPEIMEEVLTKEKIDDIIRQSRTHMIK